MLKANFNVIRPWPGYIFEKNALRRRNISSSHFTPIQGIFRINCRLTAIFLSKCLRNLVGWALRAAFLVPTLVVASHPVKHCKAG